MIMENLLLMMGYGIAFLMAFTSMLIELSNRYGSYFQFTLRSYYSYLYCGAYGLVGFAGYWLYLAGMQSIGPIYTHIEHPVIRTIISAIIIGWSAKGLLDAPLLPSRAREGDHQEPFRFRSILNLLFLNAESQFDNIIARKQRRYFEKSIESFKTGKYHTGKDSDLKKNFEKRVYDFLDLHPHYGDGTAQEIAKFNTFLTQFAKQEDIESSCRFAYRNLGYNLFKALMK
jgi:hypothetical protein